LRAEDLDSLFTGVVTPGVYRLRSNVTPASLAVLAAEYGWRLFYLEGSQIVDKATFLAAAATALDFPSYFGYNWDAFEELINDLAWTPAQGYVILYDDVAPFATRSAPEWQVALEILREATANWQRRGVPLIALLRRAGGAAPDAPLL
jgi:hypothetical protein